MKVFEPSAVMSNQAAKGGRARPCSAVLIRQTGIEHFVDSNRQQVSDSDNRPFVTQAGL